jgi:arylformamidase
MKPDSNVEHEYLTGQLKPTFGALFETFSQANDRALSRLPFEMDLVYGPHERQRYDLCLSDAPTNAVVVYLHAGYWQSRDKSQFRFLAEPIHAAGMTLALVNYPLCPDVSVREITLTVQHVIPAIQKRLSHLPNETPWILCGHSAGAHLVVEMALSLQRAQSTAPNIRGILGIGGVYELTPLVHTTLNNKLMLDESSAITASPVRRIHGQLPRAFFVVGGQETSSFHQQSADMAHAWQQAGNDARYVALPDKDHFSILWGQDVVDLLLQLADPS